MPCPLSEIVAAQGFVVLDGGLATTLATRPVDHDVARYVPRPPPKLEMGISKVLLDPEAVSATSPPNPPTDPATRRAWFEAVAALPTIT